MIPDFVRTVPRHELIHFYLPFYVTWIGEGSAWYWAGQLRPLDTLPLPSSPDEMIFWWETKRQTLHAYNCSGWLIRFIYEELLQSDMTAFLRFFASPSDYTLIGVESEEDLFLRWRKYMNGRPPPL